MRINKAKKGFTLIELMISLVILSVLVSMAGFGYSGLTRDFKLKSYASKVEYMSKYASVAAINKSSYTGVCVDAKNKTLILREIGSSLPSNFCATPYINVLKTIDLSSEPYIELRSKNQPSSGLSSYAFDGRGIAAKTEEVCLSDSIHYSKIIVTLAGIRTKRGDGSCQP